MRSYLAITHRALGMDERGLENALERMAIEAREVGVRPQETLIAKDGTEVVTFLEAGDVSQIIRLHELAGLPEPRVHEGHRVYTALLSEPHRSH